MIGVTLHGRAVAGSLARGVVMWTADPREVGWWRVWGEVVVDEVSLHIGIQLSDSVTLIAKLFFHLRPLRGRPLLVAILVNQLVKIWRKQAKLILVQLVLELQADVLEVADVVVLGNLEIRFGDFVFGVLATNV